MPLINEIELHPFVRFGSLTPLRSVRITREQRAAPSRNVNIKNLLFHDWIKWIKEEWNDSNTARHRWNGKTRLGICRFGRQHLSKRELRGAKVNDVESAIDYGGSANHNVSVADFRDYRRVDCQILTVINDNRDTGTLSFTCTPDCHFVI